MDLSALDLREQRHKDQEHYEHSDQDEAATHASTIEHTVQREADGMHRYICVSQWCMTIVAPLLVMAFVGAIAITTTRTGPTRSSDPTTECYAQYPQLEYMTALQWWKNQELPKRHISPDEDDRYDWFQDRQPFQPIVGEETVIAGVLYTLHDETLKMTALFPPMYPEESREAIMHIVSPSREAYASCIIQEQTWHCSFRIEKISPDEDVIFDITYRPGPATLPSRIYSYSGSIPHQRAYPRIVALSCFGADNTRDKSSLIRAIKETQPDLLALQGDQTYSNVLGYGFLELVYSLNSITRSIPTLVQMDDHDYGEGNLFGAEGGAETSGDGFHAPPCIVNAIQKLAMSHMPNPESQTQLDNGIDKYFTSFSYGRVDFAILEARKFKSDYPSSTNSLLGKEQEAWLRSWCGSKRDHLKIILSQTPFASLGTNMTLPSRNSYIGEASLYDARDTNACPPEGRKRFMEIIKGCSRLVIAGDQHVGIAVTHDDYGVSQCSSPAAINDQFWRLNFEPLNKSVLDLTNQQYRVLRVSNIEESVWRNYRPIETRTMDDSIKAARKDGFLMIDFEDEKSAVCSMHGYRNGHEVAWSVSVDVEVSR